jgi:hypothetical protein
MDKQQLAERLARLSRRSRGNAADTLDDLVYKLWKESREPKPKRNPAAAPATSKAPVKKS